MVQRTLTGTAIIATFMVSAGAGHAAGQDSTAATPAMVATLNAVDSRVYGSLRLEPTGKPKELKAKISIRGATADQQMPWEIRAGACAERGQQVGPQAAFRTISVRSDGTGEVTTNLPIALTAGETYSVNVLASRTNRDRVVACGVLKPA
jgi:hypothetical protein